MLGYRRWLATITSVVLALSTPAAALADCDTYGGGGSWGTGDGGGGSYGGGGSTSGGSGGTWGGGGTTFSGPDPILFVPGLGGNSAAWTEMLSAFSAWPASRLFTMSHVYSQSNVTTAYAVRDKVNAIMAQTGAPKVDLIAHSMGGLSARYYVKALGGSVNVDAFVSLGGPNHGTDMAISTILPPPYSCDSTGACPELQRNPMSTFLLDLNSGDETPGSVRYLTWRAECDLAIVPSTSTILSGASNKTWNNTAGWGPVSPENPDWYIAVCQPGHSDLRERSEILTDVRAFVQ